MGPRHLSRRSVVTSAIAPAIDLCSGIRNCLFEEISFSAFDQEDQKATSYRHCRAKYRYYKLINQNNWPWPNYGPSYSCAARRLNGGLWRQKHVSGSWIRDHILRNSVGCIDFSMASWPHEFCHASDVQYLCDKQIHVVLKNMNHHTYKMILTKFRDEWKEGFNIIGWLNDTKYEGNLYNWIETVWEWCNCHISQAMYCFSNE